MTAAPAPDPAGIEFFEKKIRPLLAENCFKCHSSEAEKVKGGLLLDTRDALLKGGDSGPAIVPGDPEKSLLIKAVRYGDENLQMPPKNKKLSIEQIHDLESWVKMGAPDPRAGKSAQTGPPLSDPEKVRTHWAFQPIRNPAPPAVKNKRWAQTPLDNFILARIEEKSIKPAPRADKRALIRRATYDLTGLPPTPEDVEAFLADKSADAFAKVVDRLLASPHYGERWGRYWLDVARYADTKGYVFEEERRYPYAYTYRDYVIRAFNEDLPFDRFILEQIAADLQPGADKQSWAALGFLTLGRRFLNNLPDIIDDRIDVVSRGFMGLTVGCARCHDHKYDPIPTRDYYSLYGVFVSSHEPDDKPLLGTKPDSKLYLEYLAEREKREKELNDFRESKIAEVETKLRHQVGEYLLATHDSAKLEENKRDATVRARKLDPNVFHRWQAALEKWSHETNAIFSLWFALEQIPDKDFTNQVKSVLEQKLSGPINPLLSKSFAAAEPSSLKDVADRYGKLFTDLDNKWKGITKDSTNASAGACVTNILADANEEAFRKVLYSEDAPPNISRDQIPRLFDVPTAQKTRALKRKVDELDASHAGAPPRAMALVDNDTPTRPHVFVRGNAASPGAEVPRQFLEIVAGEHRKPFDKGSGRLELAEAIASRANPLTARVIVNRVWGHHFGSGIVRTPSDFGLRSDPPSHPELLDWLATRFMDEGWSLKKLHRLIMLSSVYQEAGEDDAHAAAVDPNNLLLWRFNRARLDFEAMRDTLLALAGKLDPAMGGHAVDIIKEPFSARRTVYGFIDRQNLPAMFRAFDFASPDATSPQRFYTTVPQQALFLMNSPFAIEQTKALLQRPEIAREQNDEPKIRALYRAVYQRAPDRDELKLALQFIQSRSSANLPAADDKSKRLSVWEEYAQALLLSNEVAFVD